MRLEEFDTLCASLTGATLNVQWGNSHVYKVGGKIFAMAGLPEPDGSPSFIFKADELTAHILIEAGEARRAPYLPRGNWVEVIADAMADSHLADHLRRSHDIVGYALPRGTQRALGLSVTVR